MEKKTKLKTGILIVCILLLAALAAGIGGTVYFNRTYLVIHDEVYPRATTELDFSGISNPELEKLAELPGLKLLNLRDTGISIGEYEAIQALLPDCRILWSIPFQGGFLSDDTTELTVTSLTEEDIALLHTYLPGLTHIHAEECADYPQLLQLRKFFPSAEVVYTVPVNGRQWSLDTEEMTLTDANVPELEEMLLHMGRVKKISLEGVLPPAEDLDRLLESYPQIRFYWQIEVLGKTADVDTTELDFSGIPLETVEEIEAAAAYLPSLERVYMHRCGISNEEMEALNLRNEDVLFVWTVKIGYLEYSTDVTTFMPLRDRLTLTDSNSYNMRYLTELVCVDLGHQEITQIDFAAHMPKLKYLIIGDTDVGDLSPLTGLDQLIYLELFDTPVTDYEPLLTLTALENLNLSYTYGDYELIAQMTWVDYIRWVQNYKLQITDEQKDYLRAQMPDTLLELGAHTSATAGEWRKTKNYYDMRDMLGMFYMHG